MARVRQLPAKSEAQLLESHTKCQYKMQCGINPDIFLTCGQCTLPWHLRCGPSLRNPALTAVHFLDTAEQEESGADQYVPRICSMLTQRDMHAYLLSRLLQLALTITVNKKGNNNKNEENVNAKKSV